MFKHNFEWDEKNEKLIEIREGNELVNSKNEKVNGEYINKTLYPKVEALNLVKELERQIAELNIALESKTKELEELKKKDGIVDKEFMRKFEIAMNRLKLKPAEEYLENVIDAKSQISEQLEKIKKVFNI